MLSPLHEHPLEQVNPMEVYQAYGGRWKCDNCNSEKGAMNSFPFHCRQCSFDLCYSCMHMYHQGSNLIHQHQLLYTETSQLLYQNQNGIWRCAVCKNTSDNLRETFSFHCLTCSEFDICRNCYEPKRHPVHIHELKVVDTSLIYADTGGSWACDICDNPSRPCEGFSHHCADFEFNVCQDCFKPHITPLHEHPLYRADSHHVYVQFNGGWRCDRCGSVHNNPIPTIEVPPYILARGFVAKAAYHRALETGKTSDKRVKILLVGQDRVGKTSVARSLKDFERRETNQDRQSVVPEEVAPAGAILKEGILFDDDLEELSMFIANDWMRLGRRLGVNLTKLDEIDARWPDLHEKAYRMLLFWKQENSSNATYRFLCQALCHKFVNRKDLAESICFH